MAGAEKQQKLEQVLDADKGKEGLQLGKPFEEIFKNKENRNILVNTVKGKFDKLNDETKDFLKRSCQNEIDSWTKGKTETEIKGLKDELNPNPQNPLRNSGKIAVFYLYDALNNMGKKDANGNDYKQLEMKNNGIDLAIQNAKTNIENDKNMNMAINKPVTPIQLEQRDVSEKDKLDIAALSNPEKKEGPKNVEDAKSIFEKAGYSVIIDGNSLRMKLPTGKTIMDIHDTNVTGVSVDQMESQRQLKSNIINSVAPLKVSDVSFDNSVHYKKTSPDSKEYIAVANYILVKLESKA